MALAQEKDDNFWPYHHGYREPNSSHWKSPGAKYTITVLALRRNGFDFGLRDYPIPKRWGESDREYLNGLILDHYMMREIGFETEEMFRTALNAKMREVMPYYNWQFDALLLEYDPLVDHDRKDAHDERTTEHSNGTYSSTHTHLHTDTPQNNVDLYADARPEGIFSKFLTDGDLDTESGQGEFDGNGTDAYGNTYTGRSRPGQELASQYMALARPLYTRIINELEPLFMGLWR